MKAGYIFFCLPLLLLFSCDHNNDDTGGNGQDTCVYYPLYGTPNSEVSSREYNFAFPCFNPANSDEFVYIRYKGIFDQTDFQLRKHVLSTGQDVLLLDLSLNYYYISWDKTGWIYFNDPSNRIWRVRDNGQDLTQVTTSGGFFHISTCPNGQYIVVHKNGSPKNHTIVLDNNGNHLDTLGNSNTSKTWVNDTLLFMIYGSITDTSTWKLMSYPGKTVYKSGMMFGVSQILDGMNENEILYSPGSGIYVFNLNSSLQKLIKKNCGQRYDYWKFSYSQQSQKILCELQKINLTDSIGNMYYFDQTNDIVLMNRDGSGEQIIELPQQ